MAASKPATIPVVWKTSKEVAQRLLGQEGMPLLERDIELVREAAARRKWPLKRIQMEHFQDAEDPDWEMVRVVLVFNTAPRNAERFLSQFLEKEAQQYADSLSNKKARSLYLKRITHGFAAQ